MEAVRNWVNASPLITSFSLGAELFDNARPSTHKKPSKTAIGASETFDNGPADRIKRRGQVGGGAQ